MARLSVRFWQKKLLGRVRRNINDLKNLLDIRRLDPFASPAFVPDPSTKLVVSLTSFPARIDHAWITIESLFRQTIRPARIVLVLSEEEFPGQRGLPKTIEAQRRRGLTVLWVKENIRSYKKLFPVKNIFDDCSIVTVDDDVLYDQDMLKGLVDAHDRCPGAIVGNFGRVVPRGGAVGSGYVGWPEAHCGTHSERVFLIGVGGILYPSSVLRTREAGDLLLARKLCPTADDVWFWAMSVLEGTRRSCLGRKPYRELRVMRSAPALSDANRGQGENDRQLREVVEFFQLPY